MLVRLALVAFGPITAAPVAAEHRFFVFSLTFYKKFECAVQTPFVYQLRFVRFALFLIFALRISYLFFSGAPYARKRFQASS
jgi:hypothetical protein